MGIQPFPFPPIDKNATDERMQAFLAYKAELEAMGAAQPGLLGSLVLLATIAGLVVMAAVL